MPFDRLGLRAELLKALTAKGYTTPTPIQTQAIPVIVGGRDILARAQTGTGKTDAFALPLVEILSREKGNGRDPRALVLTPTRELALQVGESIKALSRTVALRCSVVYGGVRIKPQIDRLKRGIDILVATPGRLLDLAGQRHLNLSGIAFLVFDEADRMLDLGFSAEISAILDLVPTERRTMLFSATYTRDIRALAGRMLRDPEVIEATPNTMAAEAVIQKVYRVDVANKGALLIHLITRGNWRRTLVFRRTKHGADKLIERLSARGIRCAALHGDKSQALRTRTLKAFKNGEISILVATDVAARGLDISQLAYVVNYDMPTIPEDYVHRIGRTGRAGASGRALSLVSHDEKPHLKAIEKLLKQKITVEKVDGYTEDSDVPDFVLYRPNNPSSELKADKELKEIVARRTLAKQRSNARKKKKTSPAKSARPKPKSRSDRRSAAAAKKRSRSESRPSKFSPKSKARGRG
jgi:ATP-dependent RNA helicase RhlE